MKDEVFVHLMGLCVSIIVAGTLFLGAMCWVVTGDAVGSFTSGFIFSAGLSCIIIILAFIQDKYMKDSQ